MSPPRTIGQYRIGERLATGGAGEVYAGIDTKVGREVAIKFLRPELASDPSFVDRFLAEVKSLGRLNHPNIATLYALPQEDDHVCMIMELVPGRTVEQIIQDRRGPLGIRESLAILAQVADGLAYAHEQGVIHRDIKPSNLMVTESGRVKILDFGIARVRGSERLTRQGEAIGTLLYMSPEQWKGLEGDERSDIYSLANVLYELLAGAPPFKGTSLAELMKAHLSTPPPPLIPRIAGVEPPLESAIMSALSKRPEQRFPSMRTFSDATGATALRGDATGIIKNQARLARGQGAAREPPQRAPLHTIALAVVRSRAATIARRFRGLHPAVQGVSVGVLAAIVAAVLLREPSPITSDPRPGPSESFNGDQDGKQRQIQPTPTPTPTPTPAHNDPIRSSPNKARTESAPDNGLSKTPCNKGFIGNEKGKFSVGVGDCDNDPTKAPALAAVKEDHPPQTEASSRRDAEKLSFADFETAEKNKNYGAAFDLATKLDAARKPEGAYALGLLYFRGEGFDAPDKQKAFDYFHKAALAEYGMAQFKLGAMYHGGFGVRSDLTIASSWYAKAAQNGVGEAMSVLSEICRKNKARSIPACEQDWKDRAN